jgi:protein-tyrosine phosphatase
VSSEERPRIVIATAPNLRDIGGWPTTGGSRIRAGQVFRSAGLSDLGGEDLEAFAALGIRTVYDLRTAAEVAEQPDVLPEGTDLEHADVLADAQHAAPAELRQIFADTAVATQLLGEGQAERYFEQAYRDFVSLPSAKAAYRELFEGIARAEGPVLFHCATGKDRTGWATASLLLLLGVPMEEVLEEYLLTNTDLLPTLQHWLDAFRDNGGDPDLLLPILGVQPSYLEAALEEVRREYGDVEQYFTEGLGLSPSTVAALRTRLVVN